MEERRKKRKKIKTPENCKSLTQMQRFITTIKSVTEYTHVYSVYIKSKESNKNKVQYIDLANKGNQKIISTRTKLTKAKTGKQN